MNEVPERIWLQSDDDPESDWFAELIVTWCQDKINDEDVEYILATKYAEMEAENERLVEALEIIAKAKYAEMEAENERLRSAAQFAYRKHHLDDPNIGWDELSDILYTALCESMGDNEFVKWIDAAKGSE